MRESERNWKRAGELKASRHFINEQKEMFHTVLVWGFYRQNPFTNYQKLQIQTLLQGESKKKTKKRTKSEEVKRAAGTMLET